MFPLSLSAREWETTHDIVVDGIFIARDRLVSEVVGRAVNAKHEIFLERPSGDVARKLFIPGLVSAEKKRMSGLEEDKGMMTGKLDARRKWLVHVCVRKELDATDPGDVRTTIARLETSHDTQITARPEALAGAVRSVEQSLCARVGIRIGREALGRGVKDGDQQGVVAVREGNAGEPYGRGVARQQRMR